MRLPTGKRCHAGAAVELCSWVLLVLVSFNVQHVTANEDNTYYNSKVYNAAREEVTSRCDIYLAPSAIGGWGVFAGRDFEQYEVVELALRYIPMKHEYLKTNVLDDYHYGFTFQSDVEDQSFGVAILGMSMFYNHGEGEKQNVIYTNFGHEPVKENPWVSQIIGFAAKRNIQRGEELLSTYGVTGEWFASRGLTIASPPEEQKLPSLEFMERQEQQYCSKAVSGIGHSTWFQRVVPTQELAGQVPPKYDAHKYMPLQDHPTAIAKESVQAGEVIEMAPALVLPLNQVEPSALGTMMIFWNAWDDEQKESIYKLREEGAFRMKGVERGDNGEDVWSLDVMEYYDDAAVFPAAGNIGMVRKVGRDNASSNCRLELASSMVEDFDGEFDVGSAGVVLKLIATKDIQAGEELRLNLPDLSSWDSKMLLQQHLAMTGQPIPKFIADAYNPDIMDVPLTGEDEL